MSHIDDLEGPAASLDARRDTLDHRENLRRSPNHPRAVAFWRRSRTGARFAIGLATALAGIYLMWGHLHVAIKFTP